MAHTTFEHPKARTCMKLILIALLLLFTACADEAVPGGEETTSPAKTEEQTQTTEGETEQQEDVTENASEAETTQTEPSDIQDAQEQTEPEGTNATTEFTNAEFRAIYWGPGSFLQPSGWRGFPIRPMKRIRLNGRRISCSPSEQKKRRAYSGVICRQARCTR